MRGWVPLLASIAIASAAAGCTILQVSEQRASLEALSRIRGSVSSEKPTGSPIVVVLLQSPDSQEGAPRVYDHYRLERPGRFAFVTSAGSFRLSAFEDLNANLVYDPGEPVLAGQPFFRVESGESLDDLELLIPADQSLDQRFDIAAMEARTPRDQQHFSLGRFTVKGEIAKLDDPRFGPESGPMGMWRFADFMFERGPGVYFLEAYDPKKIPVLFVHGISGYPQEFSSLIEKLDRSRFQPWFYFYPSGIQLDAISNHLNGIVQELHQRHGFDELAVVAHSMGGLVSRSFALKYWEQTGLRQVRALVTISTPWGGSSSTDILSEAPEDLVVYSWLDMAPDSEFLKSLYSQPPEYLRARSLPEHTHFHMIFGYRRDESSFGPSADGVVTVKSEARLEAVEAARSVLPLDYGHVEILHSGEAINHVNSILGAAF